MATRKSKASRDIGSGDARLKAFRDYLDACTPRVDAALDRLIPGTRTRPGLIHEAMRYTVLSEGKRLRPALVLLAYESCGGRGRRAETVAAALEMVHAFSLIHDDLPAMDDDDFRRGKPSNHVVFGEGVAILAGDALLSQAFLALTSLRRRGSLGPEITAHLVEELSSAIGSTGVIGGQVLDLVSEGAQVSRGTVDFIHRQKTARLFMAALRMGGVAAGASTSRLRALAEYGETTGTAFQVVDDILGAAGSFRELGRDPGHDEARGKATYPAVVGTAASHRTVDRQLRRARDITARFPGRRDEFLGLVELLDRRRRDSSGALLGLGEAR